MLVGWSRGFGLLAWLVGWVGWLSAWLPDRLEKKQCRTCHVHIMFFFRCPSSNRPVNLRWASPEINANNMACHRKTAENKKRWLVTMLGWWGTCWLDGWLVGWWGGWLVVWPINHVTNQPTTNQPTNQSTNHYNRPTNQPTNHYPTNEPTTNHAIHQP